MTNWVNDLFFINSAFLRPIAPLLHIRFIESDQ